MSIIIDSPTELTTAVTDFLLALFSMVVLLIVYSIGHSRDPKKTRIWVWAFGLLTVASLFGAAAHGFKMSERMNFILWQPINLSLGLTIALFVAGVVYDLRKFSIPFALIIALLTIALVFYLITILVPGSFAIFIIYESVAMLFALTSYLILSFREKKKGYWFMSAGILVTMIAAAIQATGSINFKLVWEFDHNGIFHLVQIIGLFFLLTGLRFGFLSQSFPGKESA